MNVSKAQLRVGAGVAALAIGVPLAAALANPLTTSSSSPSAGSKLPAELQTIRRLIGDWRGSGSGKLGAESVSVRLTLSCTGAAGGFGVQCKTRFTGLPGGSAEETDLFGFDPGQRKYHWFSVTSLGETHDHVAEMPAGDTLRFVYDGVTEGKPMQEVISLKISDDHHIEFQNTSTVGGQLVWTLSGSATK